LNASFWTYLDELIRSTEVIIDRPRGSAHPRYPELVYPLDYGYLKGTTGGDGHDIDLWRGTAIDPKLDAIVCTVDLSKRDAEIKLLLGCTDEEKAIILGFHNDDRYQSAILVERTAG
jgi:inorganic pyrophosphatase